MPASTDPAHFRLPLSEEDRTGLIAVLSPEGREAYEAHQRRAEGWFAAVRERRHRPAKFPEKRAVIWGSEATRALDAYLVWLIKGGRESELEPLNTEDPWCARPWNVAVLPDGRTVPDRLKRHTLRAVPFKPMGVWLHESERGRASDYMDAGIPFVVFMAVFAPVIAGLVIYPTPMRGNGFFIAAWWVALPIIVFFAFRGRALRTARLPPPSESGSAEIWIPNDPLGRDAGEAVARWAADDLGARPVEAIPYTRRGRPVGGVYAWQLDHGSKITTGLSLGLMGDLVGVETEVPANADFHRRLKGQILHLVELLNQPLLAFAPRIVDDGGVPPSRGEGQLGGDWTIDPLTSTLGDRGRIWKLRIPMEGAEYESLVSFLREVVRGALPRLAPGPPRTKGSVAFVTLDGKIRLACRRAPKGGEFQVAMEAIEDDPEARRVRDAIGRRFSPPQGTATRGRISTGTEG